MAARGARRRAATPAGAVPVRRRHGGCRHHRRRVHRDVDRVFPDRDGTRHPHRAARGGYLWRRPERAQRRLPARLVGVPPLPREAVRAGAGAANRGAHRTRWSAASAPGARAWCRRLVHAEGLPARQRLPEGRQRLGRIDRGARAPGRPRASWSTSTARAGAGDLRLARLRRRGLHAERGHRAAGTPGPRPAPGPARAGRRDPRGDARSAARARVTACG